ncbi:hypothetical protein GCWU000325_02384 [Alloprevotella tannerae ATCC 51259]|uniref:Uncharacterized protein n=1 Tax=Alloprevotella tannerae ATCC 51259 TaxID=626522 RepID=C9LJH2_9BACT|nr:hypothetical protein GCWU000325_02384 [Alloprevotella tannerae ATCC 51259]
MRPFSPCRSYRFGLISPYPLLPARSLLAEAAFRAMQMQSYKFFY